MPQPTLASVPQPAGSKADNTPRGAAGGHGPAAPDPANTLLVAADGRHLAASWFEPAATSAHAVALISSATGVPRGYYRAFAQWLAQRGYAVLSYDYRGIAGSRRGPVGQETASMRDWALLDMPAAITAARARAAAEGLPLLLVGHSFGGNCIAFAEGVQHASALLTIGSQLGEPRFFPGHRRWLAELYFRALLPACVAVLGYAPRWAAGGEPLPAGVALEWARWGLTHGWAYASPDMQAHRQAAGLVLPVHLWGMSDDLQYAPPRAIDALAEQFRSAAVQRHTQTPQDAGVKALGHFGPFRRSASALWPQWLAAIEEAAPALAQNAPHGAADPLPHR